MTDKMRAAFVEVLKAAVQTTREEIEALRNEGKTFYVIRHKDKLYLSYNIKLIRPYLTSTNHLCGDCKRCRAMPTESGGCDKVWHRMDESHIFKYNFITLGVEAFSPIVDREFFAVTACTNFAFDPPRPNSGRVWIDPDSPIQKYIHSTNRNPPNVQWPIPSYHK